MAKLYFRYGAMNSGKSIGLLQTAYNYEERGQRVLLIKAVVDTKGEDFVVSRLGVSRRVDLLVDADDDLRALVRRRALAGAQAVSEGGWEQQETVPLREVLDCVLIDEAQFLTALQVDQLMEIVLVDDVPVLAYGIRTDFRTVSFPGSRRLLEIAHSLEELKTICRCGRKAVFNARKVGSPSSSTATRWPSTPGTSPTSRCAESATSPLVGGSSVSEPSSGVALVLGGIQGEA